VKKAGSVPAQENAPDPPLEGQGTSDGHFHGEGRSSVRVKRREITVTVEAKLAAALKTLKEAVHDVGETFVDSGGTAHIWMNDVACTYEEIFRMAEDEKTGHRYIQKADI
jgi:hypothetical protein